MIPAPRLALIAALAAALAACGNTASTTGPGSNFTVIGDSAITIGPTGGNLTYAAGINDSGTVVGVVVDVTSIQYGWELKGGFLQFLTATIPSSANTTPQTINDSGNVAGFYTVASAYHAFIFDGSTYSTFDYPASTSTQAYGMNASGTIVGAYFVTGSTDGHAFKLSGGTFTNIDPPSVTSSVALGINALGDIVGEYTDNAGQHGYVWLHGATAPTEITQSGVDQMVPYSINDTGAIVGSCTVSGVSYGFLLQGTTFKIIQAPNSSATQAYGINNAGVVVGEYTNSVNYAFQLATQ